MNNRVYEVVKPCRIGSKPVAMGTVFNERAPNPTVIIVGRLSERFLAFRPEDETAILAAERRTGKSVNKADLRSVLLARGCLREIK